MYHTEDLNEKSVNMCASISAAINKLWLQYYRLASTRTRTYLKLGERVLVLVHAEALFLEVGDRVLHSVHPLHEVLQSAPKLKLRWPTCTTHPDFTRACIKTKYISFKKFVSRSPDKHMHEPDVNVTLL